MTKRSCPNLTLSVLAFGVLALVAVACASGGGDEVVDAAAGPGGADGLPSTEAAAAPTTAREVDDDFGLPVNDAAPPPVTPSRASGAPGFSHYVFEEVGGEVLLGLVEGPVDFQVRCQEVDLPCSYSDILELADSDAPVPEELRMTAEEVDQLADELRAANAAMARYEDPNNACAEGGTRTTDQTPNMGIHIYLPAEIDDGEFAPGEPDIILYDAAGDGEPPAGTELGQCRGGRWDGVALELVGFSYSLPMNMVGPDHPEGFTGPLDNWHVHYNLCTGPRFDLGATLTADACEEAGGNYVAEHGWMIHAWVDSDNDNQLGLFALWNPTIWPLADVVDGYNPRPNVPEGVDPSNFVSIENFEFEDVTVSAGEAVVFANGDGVPHTVTAGSASDIGDEFDTGLFGPGQTAELSFDTPGDYEYFCALHPQMTGTVIVE